MDRRFFIKTIAGSFGTAFLTTMLVACEKIPLLPALHMTGSITGSVTGSVTGSFTGSISGSDPWTPNYDEHTGSIKL